MKEKFLKYFKGDTAIWLIILLLTIFSMLAVYSATGTLAYKKMGGNTSYFLFRHLAFLIFGIGITFVVHNMSYKVFFSVSQILVYISVPLLMWTLVRGVSLNEAARWVTLPGTGISFQTSDLAKFALIMYVARILASNQENIGDPKAAFRPILIWVAIICPELAEGLREEFMIPLGLSANALAMALRVPAPRINDIARERRAITADTALRLARYFGTSAEFWLGLQSDFEIKITLAKMGARIDPDISPMAQAA